MRLLNFLAALPMVAALDCAAAPFWGAKHSAPADTPIEALQPGEFIWEGELEPHGPVVVVVSLPEQMAYVYRNGVRIGVATASTGKQGHGTPTGVFTILNKDKDHHSKTYGNAPMPYSERLTVDGVALHAGGLPGYPSSHGCVHLPSEFARLLFGITHKGTTVVIASQSTTPRSVVHPAVLAPVDATTGAAEPDHTLGLFEDFRWEPEASPRAHSRWSRAPPTGASSYCAMGSRSAGRASRSRTTASPWGPMPTRCSRGAPTGTRAGAPSAYPAMPRRAGAPTTRTPSSACICRGP